MNTRRLFREDVYLKTCEAVVQTVSTHEGKVLVTLDQTIFFPTGGGQSCDIGTMSGLPVVDVYEYKDDILHCVDCSPDALQSGDTVQLAIDWTIASTTCSATAASTSSAACSTVNTAASTAASTWETTT